MPASHGSSKTYATLAPVISDLQQRQLGDRRMFSKLTHAIVIARNLMAHGGTMSESVLNVACKNGLELIPPVAALAQA